MAVAVRDQTLKDSGVSVHGMAKRNQRKLDSFQKVSSVLANGSLLNTQGKTVVSKLAKSKKPQATKPVLPKTQPLEKAVTKKVAMPKPVKVEAKKAVARIKKPRTDRVAALIAMPERTLVSPQFVGKTYPAHTQQLESWSAQQVESYHMAREFDHDRYYNNQDETEIGCILFKYRTKANGKRVKTKAKGYVERNAALHNTLERLATFKSMSHLTDDEDQYDCTELIVKNNITISGVRITLGFKREWVMVPRNSTSAKAEKRAKLDRFESIKSRTFTPAIVEPVTEVLEELDPPPWQDYALDAVKTAADGIARGYASLEKEFDIKPSDYTAHHIPRGVNVQDLPGMAELVAQEKRDHYLEGLVYLSQPHYLVDIILAARRSSNDEPEPTTPAPAVAQIPDWTSLEGDALDAELRLCFQALNDRDNAAHVDGHFHPATLRRMTKKFGTTYEQWTTTFTARKNRGVLIRQHYEKIAWFAKERKAALKYETATRGKVHGYRKKNVFIKMQQKKTFKIMEGLRQSRERHEKMIESHIQSALQRMEQTHPSDPRNEGDRYDEWFAQSDRNPESSRGYEITEEQLVYHLKHMETQRSYDDAFGIVHHSASYLRHKVMPIPRCRSLTTPEDNIHLDLPPPTGAVADTEPTVDIVGQDNPHFLIAGDVVVPFTAGTNILTEVFSPLKGIMLRRSRRTLFGLGIAVPAFG